VAQAVNHEQPKTAVVSIRQACKQPSEHFGLVRVTGVLEDVFVNPVYDALQHRLVSASGVFGVLRYEYPEGLRVPFDCGKLVGEFLAPAFCNASNRKYLAQNVGYGCLLLTFHVCSIALLQDIVNGIWRIEINYGEE
jgi:hypothetical protein